MNSRPLRCLCRIRYYNRKVLISGHSWNTISDKNGNKASSHTSIIDHFSFSLFYNSPEFRSCFLPEAECLTLVEGNLPSGFGTLSSSHATGSHSVFSAGKAAACLEIRIACVAPFWGSQAHSITSLLSNWPVNPLGHIILRPGKRMHWVDRCSRSCGAVSRSFRP